MAEWGAPAPAEEEEGDEDAFWQEVVTQEVPQRRPKSGVAGDGNTVFTNAKSGMEGVDAEHVKRVVYEMSKASHADCS